MKQVTIAFVIILILIGGIFLYKKTNKSNTVVPSQSTASGTAQSQQIQLTVTSPTDGQTVTTPNIIVTGKTVGEAEISINEKDIVADAEGNFSIPVILDEGENILSISAHDKEGNYAEKELTIIFESEQ